MDDTTLFSIIVFALAIIILAGTKRSRYVPKKSRDLAWAKFVQEFYRDPANRGKTPRKKDYEFDHVYPHSKGGSNDPNNIRVIPKKKNRKKGAKLPWETAD